MKRSVSLLLLGAALILTGCKEVKINDYVQQSVDLDKVESVATGDALEGKVAFRHTTTWTAYQTVCQTAICGYDSVYRCHNVTHCNQAKNDFFSLISTAYADESDRPGAQDRYPRPGTGSGSRPPGSGTGAPRNPPHPSQPAPHEPRPSRPHNPPHHHHPVCHTHQECGYVQVPRYCQVNCQQVPYTDSSTQKIVSQVKVKVLGLEGLREPKEAIQELTLGLKTNSEFRRIVGNPNEAPEELKELVKEVKADDELILVLKGKGVKLRKDQAIVKLPDTFKKGDTIELTLQVDATGDQETYISILGSKDKFPELETSSPRD